MNFFFWFFFVGFFIALLQDLKRREVDNWLNLFLFFSGFIYVVANVFIFSDLFQVSVYHFLIFLAVVSFLVISLFSDFFQTRFSKSKIGKYLENFVDLHIRKKIRLLRKSSDKNSFFEYVSLLFLVFFTLCVSFGLFRIYGNDFPIFILYSSFFLIMFCLTYLFYFSRIFAGGDCKLLFATTPLLVSFNFVNSFHNILFFCLAMLFIGAIYGLFWIVGLFFKNLRKNLIDLRNLIKKNYYIFIGVCFLFVLTFFDKFFIGVGFIFLFSYLLFLISKVIEKNSLTREIYTKELREGDWLEKDIKFRGRLIKSSFEGISLGEIEFLKNYKNKITIKDGIPYAPVFLFTWILFYFRGIIEDLIFGLIG